MTCPTRPDERLFTESRTPPNAVQDLRHGGKLLSLRPGAAHAHRRPHQPRHGPRPALARADRPPARPLSGRGQTRTMSEQANRQAEPSNIVVVGPDGVAIEGGESGEGDHGERPGIEMVEQPAKVMRIGSMIRQL